MILCSWLGHSPCRIENGKVIAGDEEFIIESIKEYDGYKTMTYTFFGGMLIGLLVALGISLPTLFRGNSKHLGVDIFVLVLALVLYCFGMRAVWRHRIYATDFKFNGFYHIHLEEREMGDYYDQLKAIEATLSEDK